MPGRPPPSLLALPSFAMGRASARARREVVAALAERQLLLRHYAVLAAVEHYAPCAQRDLAESLGWDAADLVGLLGAVERRGLVARRRDPSDRRRLLVELTDAGRDTVAWCHQVATAAQEPLLAPLTPAERRLLRELLARLA